MDELRGKEFRCILDEADQPWILDDIEGYDKEDGYVIGEDGVVPIRGIPLEVYIERNL